MSLLHPGSHPQFHVMARERLICVGGSCKSCAFTLFLELDSSSFDFNVRVRTREHPTWVPNGMAS